MRTFIHRYLVYLFNGTQQDNEYRQADSSLQITSSLDDVAVSRDITIGVIDVEGGTTHHISLAAASSPQPPLSSSASNLSHVHFEGVAIGSYCYEKRRYGDVAHEGEQVSCLGGSELLDVDDDQDVVLGVDALEAGTATGGGGCNASRSSTAVLCTICMCAVKRPVRLPCNHVFCTKPCLQSWSYRSSQCPNCRALINVEAGKNKRLKFDSFSFLQCTEQVSTLDSLVNSSVTSSSTDDPPNESSSSRGAATDTADSRFVILDNPASGQHGSRFTLVTQFGREKYERLKLSLHLLMLWSLFALFLFLFFLIYQHHLKYGRSNSGQEESLADGQKPPQGDNFHSYLASFPSIV